MYDKEKYQKAIEKLDRETEEDINNNAYMAIAEYLRSIIVGSEDYVDAILSEEKTISEAYKYMESIACKEAKGKQGCVCFASDKAFKVIDEYYSMTDSIPYMSKSQTFGIQDEEIPEKTGNSESHDSKSEIISLFDLL